MFQGLGLGLIKASFVFFYRRMFVVKQKRPRDGFDILTWFVIAVLFAWTVAFFFAVLVTCKGNWAALWTNLETLTTECIDTPKMLLALAVSDFILDIIVLCMPLHKVRTSRDAVLMAALTLSCQSRSSVSGCRGTVSWVSCLCSR